MPFQERDPRELGASKKTKSTTDAPTAVAPEAGSAMASGVRTRITQYLSQSNQGIQSNQVQKANCGRSSTSELTREQLTSHAVGTVQRWTE